MSCDSEAENLPILAVMNCPKPFELAGVFSFVVVVCSSSGGGINEDVESTLFEVCGGWEDEDEEGVVLLDLLLRFRLLPFLLLFVLVVPAVVVGIDFLSVVRGPADFVKLQVALLFGSLGGGGGAMGREMLKRFNCCCLALVVAVTVVVLLTFGLGGLA